MAGFEKRKGPSRRKVIEGLAAAAIFPHEATGQQRPAQRPERTPGLSVSLAGLYYDGPLATPEDRERHFAHMKELAETVITKTKERTMARMRTIAAMDNMNQSIAHHVADAEMRRTNYGDEFAYVMEIEAPRDLQRTARLDYYIKTALNDDYYTRVVVEEVQDPGVPGGAEFVVFSVTILPKDGVRGWNDGIDLRHSNDKFSPHLNRPMGDVTSASGVARLPEGTVEVFDMGRGQAVPEEKLEHIRRAYRGVLEVLAEKLR